MLGFELDFWDYATFATAALSVPLQRPDERLVGLQDGDTVAVRAETIHPASGRHAGVLAVSHDGNPSNRPRSTRGARARSWYHECAAHKGCGEPARHQRASAFAQSVRSYWTQK